MITQQQIATAIAATLALDPALALGGPAAEARCFGMSRDAATAEPAPTHIVRAGSRCIEIQLRPSSADAAG
ncbi:MAG: hypothetical protein M3P16_07595 [Chloroflexota bacterium]|nr:hypothetical protein [Chloroflexota bacterium]